MRVGWKREKSGPGSTITGRVMSLPHIENIDEQGFSSRIILAVVTAYEVDFNSHGPGRKDKNPLQLRALQCQPN